MLLVMYYQVRCDCFLLLIILIWGIVVFVFSAIFIPDPKDGSLYAFGSVHDGLKVLKLIL